MTSRLARPVHWLPSAAATVLVVGLGALAATGTASGQSLTFSDSKSGLPIEIVADDGIEWQQDNLLFLARGNARATRGEVSIYADVLRAYYREGNSGTDIWRLDAEGSVRIQSPTETAHGQKAVYDVDNAILVLSGGKVRLVTATDELTAEKQIEWWEKKQMAVARGNALAIREDKRLSADILAAYLNKDETGKARVFRVDAFERVRIVTGDDIATAERGVYNVESGIATLMGSVRIKRGPHLLDGCRAEVNLNTGISKLFSCPPGVASGKRVHGVIHPGTVRQEKNAKR